MPVRQALLWLVVPFGCLVVGGSVVALMEVPRSQTGLYGVATLAEGSDPQSEVVQVVGMVEKPDPAEAPSNLAIIGRYELHPSVFGVLENTPPGRGGATGGDHPPSRAPERRG